MAYYIMLTILLSLFFLPLSILHHHVCPISPLPFTPDHRTDVFTKLSEQDIADLRAYVSKPVLSKVISALPWSQPVIIIITIIIVINKELCLELRERRQGFKVKVIPAITGCCGGGLRELKRDFQEQFSEKTFERITEEMQKTVSWESENIIK